MIGFLEPRLLGKQKQNFSKVGCLRVDELAVKVSEVNWVEVTM